MESKRLSQRILLRIGIILGTLMALIVGAHGILPSQVHETLSWIEEKIEFRKYPLTVLVTLSIPYLTALFYRLENLASDIETLTKVNRRLNIRQILNIREVRTLKQAVNILSRAIDDESVRVVYLDKELTLFKDFVGNFYAINAPMIWENRYLQNEEADPVRVHLLRYLNPAFERANYFYPIFVSLGNYGKARWAYRIYRFFAHLKRAVFVQSDTIPGANRILGKLVFWMPDSNPDAIPMSENHNTTATTFAGMKAHTKHIIFYYATTMFADRGERPDIAVLCHNEGFYQRISDLAANLQEELIPHSLDTFLLQIKAYLTPAEIAKIDVDVERFIQRRSEITPVDYKSVDEKSV